MERKSTPQTTALTEFRDRCFEHSARWYRYLYKKSYIFAARIVRYLRSFQRKNRHRFAAWSAKGAVRSERIEARRRLWLLSTRDRLFAPITGARQEIVLSMERVRTATERRWLVVVRESGAIAVSILRPLLKLIFRLLNYLAPVVAAWILISTINYFDGLTFALQVEYDGQMLGYIQSEAIFDDAETNVKNRIIYEEYKYPEDSIPRFTLCVVNNDKLTPEDELTDKLIAASDHDIQQASGFYIDDIFIGATSDPDTLLSLLDGRLEEYRSGAENETVSFIKKIRLEQGLYPVSSMVTVDNIEQVINGEVEGETVYIVQKGDDPLKIAGKNDLSLTELVALNPGILERLMVGDEVLISKSEPYLGVQLTRRETYEVETSFGTTQENDSSLYRGFTRTISSGIKGRDEVVADVTYIDGIEISRKIVSTQEITAPINQVIAVGTAQPYASGAAISSAGFIWPVQGSYRVSCHFGGYPGHTGTDIVANTGTPIYAAQSGKVVLATQVWGGYGMHLIIDHGGQLQTLYAHCSAMYVRVGDIVSQGQVIAAVGSTGNSSGAHLHFEIKINGAAVNAYPYIAG